MAITRKQIVGSLASWINANVTGHSTTVVYPGRDVDTQSLSDWVEVEVGRVRPNPFRKQSPKTGKCEIILHCYAKRTTNLYRAMRLVKIFCDAIEHAEIPIRNYSVGGTPRTGWMRLTEPGRENDTRDFNEPQRTDTRYIGVKFEALIQAD